MCRDTEILLLDVKRISHNIKKPHKIICGEANSMEMRLAIFVSEQFDYSISLKNLQ